MEASLEQVAAKCSKQLNTFQRCILANQRDPALCEEFRVDLSRCAANAVPLLHQVKTRCNAQVIAYDQCLAKYTSQGDQAVELNCTPRLRELWLCTESVKRDVEEKENDQVRHTRLQGKMTLGESS